MAAVTFGLKGEVPLVNSRFIAMSYEEFDQSKTGWRLLAEKRLFVEAAKLIRDFLVERRDLDLYQQDNLWFHAGQMYAFANNYAEAIACMSHSMEAEQLSHAPIQWKPYVKATIAFLKKDVKELREQKQIIAKEITIYGEIPNLALVNRMVENLNKTYESVYTDT